MKKVLAILLMFHIGLSSGAQDTTRLSLLFIGDIMQHDSQIADAYNTHTGTYDYGPCFQYIKPYIQGADVAIGNLEVTLAGKPYKGYPQFSAPDELLTALKDIGMDVIVTANNHSVDRGRIGVDRTIDMLDRADLLHTGTFKSEADKKKHHPLIIERQGFRLILLNYTYGTNGLPVITPNIVNTLDTAAIRKDLIKAATLRPDAIIVFTHWGAEYESLPSQNQKQIAELCFKHGARLVIGSHPHVLQPMEWRKKEDQFIAYSLGNFVSGQRKRYTDGGAMVRVELEKVLFKDGSTHTAIDTAAYILEWVYRTNDGHNNYYVLPVPTVVSEPKAYIKDSNSLDALNIFLQDSRSLFRKHNLHVEELTSPAQFYLEFTMADTVALRDYLRRQTGVSQALHPSRYPKMEIGPLSYPDARHLYVKIESDLAVEDLFIKAPEGNMNGE